jgi:hypothetical protein
MMALCHAAEPSVVHVANLNRAGKTNAKRKSTWQSKAINRKGMTQCPG